MFALFCVQVREDILTERVHGGSQTEVDLGAQFGRLFEDGKTDLESRREM